MQNQAVVELLASMAARMSDLSAPMRTVAAVLEENVRRRFHTQTDPNGQPWAQWSPATLASYPKWGNRRILDRSGDMLRSLNAQSDRTSATVGFSAVTGGRGKGRTAYAVFHEFGTGKMPARRMLFSNPETGELGQADETAILTTLLRHFHQ